MDYKVTDTELTNVANAIRTKGGTSGQLTFPSDFITAIENISGGGSKNILGGLTNPTSADGVNGDIYIKYMSAGIKNSNAQSINTGYSGNTNTKIVCDFQVTKAQTSEWPTLFGGRPNGDNVNDSIAYQMAGNSYYYNGGMVSWNANNAVSGSGANTLIGKTAHVELSNGLFKLSADGINIEQAIPTANITNSTSIILFGHGVNGTPQLFGTTDGIIINRFKIYENDALIHDFVPSKDTNDIVCLYDEITQEYKYVNSGTLGYIKEGSITSVYLKVNGVWTPIENCNWDDVNTGSD